MSIPAFLLLVAVTLWAGGAPRRCAAGGPRATDAMDVRAMQAIAKSTGADKSLGWGVKSPDPCGGTWPGVRCDGEPGRVTSIDASNGGLVGRISGADLSDLSFLSSLDVSFNRLDGDLPVLPRSLSYLKTLNLSSNSFLGIPDSFFFSFPALETFAIDDNTVITGLVPEDLVRCPALRTFSANNVTLSGPVPEFLGNATIFPALERLSLARNHLLASIKPDFGKKSKISFLDMSTQTPEIEGDTDSLTGHLDFVAGMTELVEIHVGGNSFYGPLPDTSALVNLKVFDAANNQLCGQVKFAPSVAVNVAGNPGVGKDC